MGQGPRLYTIEKKETLRNHHKTMPKWTNPLDNMNYHYSAKRFNLLIKCFTLELIHLPGKKHGKVEYVQLIHSVYEGR